MQAAQHALGGFAVVVLHKLNRQASALGKVECVKTFKKETSGIAKDFGLQDQHFGQDGRGTV